jgi:hypothetical protein
MARVVVNWERAEVVYDPVTGIYTLTDEGVELVPVEKGDWRGYFERAFRLRNKPPMEVLEVVLGLPVTPGVPVTLEDLRATFGGVGELPRVLFDGEGGFKV